MTETTKKPLKTNKALKQAEAEFAKRREAIESDEDLSRSEKNHELLVAATELEWTVRAITERSTP